MHIYVLLTSLMRNNHATIFQRGCGFDRIAKRVHYLAMQHTWSCERGYGVARSSQRSGFFCTKFLILETSRRLIKKPTKTNNILLHHIFMVFITQIENIKKSSSKFNLAAEHLAFKVNQRLIYSLWLIMYFICNT